MTTSQISRKNKDVERRREVMARQPFDEIFDNFRHDIEDVFFAPFINPIKSSISGNINSIETRTPLCDIIDKDNRYIISLEVPGIQKDKIEVKATEEYIT